MKACPGPRCLTETPDDRDLCHFCRGTLAFAVARYWNDVRELEEDTGSLPLDLYRKPRIRVTAVPIVAASER